MKSVRYCVSESLWEVPAVAGRGLWMREGAISQGIFRGNPDPNQ